MESQKYENMLNLALQTPPDERKKSQNLNVGYEEADNSWDLIVKYNGNLTAALMNVSEQIKVSELLGGFAVLNKFNSRNRICRKTKAALFCTKSGQKHILCKSVVKPAVQSVGGGRMFCLD